MHLNKLNLLHMQLNKKAFNPTNSTRRKQGNIADVRDMGCLMCKGVLLPNTGTHSHSRWLGAGMPCRLVLGDSLINALAQRRDVLR